MQEKKAGHPLLVNWVQKIGKRKKRVKSKVKNIAKESSLCMPKGNRLPVSHSKDSFLQAELESSFFYQDTPDQLSAADIKADMERLHPMDRLICGRRFGKTEITIRAAFKAVNANKQVAILVPTTILALQHYQTFSERLQDFQSPLTL